MFRTTTLWLFFVVFLVASFGQRASGEDLNFPAFTVAVDEADKIIIEQELEKQNGEKKPLKVCSELSLSKDDSDKLLVDFDVLKFNECSVVEPSPVLSIPQFYATYSSTRIGLKRDAAEGVDGSNEVDQNERRDYSTAHRLDLSYSGVAFNEKPAKEGSFSFGAALESRMGGGELNLFGGYFKNSKNEIYSPEFVPIGLSYGVGLWLSDSEQNGVDVGAHARVENLSVGSGGRLPARRSLSLDIHSNDRVSGRSSPLTATLAGYLTWQHGQTVHDTIRLSTDFQYSDLETTESKPSDVASALVALTGSFQLPLSGVYLELGAGAFHAFSDLDNANVEDETTPFLSATIVFRKPLVLPAEQSQGLGVLVADPTGLTKVGGSAYLSNFWDTFGN